jgi:hypothetical protein
MTDIAYRPRSIAELVDASIQLFRRTYRELVTIMAIAYVPWLAATTIADRMGAVSIPAEGDPSFSLAGAMVMVAGFAWLTIVGAGCVAATSDRYLGRQPDIAQSLQRALSRAWPIIGTTLVTLVLAAFGLILLIIPGLYFFARFALSSTVALLEERPVLQSLERSATLSQGRKLHILGAMLAVWLITFAVTVTVGAVVGLLGLASVSILAEAAVGIGITPLITVVTAVLYYDLRIRAEGFDVELMERQLRTDPGPA